MISPLNSIYIYQLILLQLENYDIRRFLRVCISTRGMYTKTLRTKLVWTQKMKAVVVLSTILQVGVLIGSIGSITLLPVHPFLSSTLIIFFILGLYWLSALFFSLAVFLLSPLDWYVKTKIIGSAQNKRSQFPNLTVVGIAGSYGKTTMKDTISTVLSEKFRVLKTDENMNTPLGISRMILTELDKGKEVMVVEMGEYYPGDIAGICNLVIPNIAVVTGINEAHLSRMGSLDRTVSSIFEIVESLKKDRMVLLNCDDERIRHYYKEKVRGHKIFLYGKKDGSKSDFKISDVLFHQDGTGISFVFAFQKKKQKIKIPFLAEYILPSLIGVSEIAAFLELSFEQICSGIGKISPVSHRLEVIHGKSDVLVIDDSYNGNPDGVHEAIVTLSKFTKRRKIYLTPGLVETGSAYKDVHRVIGKKLANVADIVMLIKNSVTPFISEGLLESGFNPKNIFWYETATDAHTALSSISHPSDVILLQNDWPENYL